MISQAWARGRAPLLGNGSTLFPKFCIRQTFVQFETLANNPTSQHLEFEPYFPKPAVKQKSECYIPMGVKSVSFMSRNPTIKQQKILRSSTLLLIETQFDQLLLEKPSQFQPITSYKSTREPPLVQSTPPSSSTHKKPLKAPGPNLEMVTYQLTQDLNNIFMKRQEWGMYHKEVVLQDNIRGVKVVGLEKYMLLVNVMKLLAHIRFVYVRMTLLSVTKEEEEGIIKVRWTVVGLGMLRLVLRYFPDRLWEKGNMERTSPSYIDGYSTFYVDSNSRIYHHTMDRVMEDRDKMVVKPLVQRLMELKPKQGAQPVL